MAATTTRKDMGKTRIVAAVGAADGLRGVAGIFAGSNPGASDVAPDSGRSPITLAEIGTILHFGPVGKKRKKWPWMRIAWKQNRKSYANEQLKGIGVMLRARAAGAFPAKKIVTRIALMMSRDQVRTLTKLRTPALELSTIEAKRSSNPLIDKGPLRNAHGFEVRGKLG